MKKIALVMVATALLSGCWKTQDGEKVGTIVKFAKQGVIIGTWEGELIRGGMNDGSGAFGKSFHFTVENDVLVGNVKDYMENQKVVKIKYHKEGIVFPWRSESDGYFLDDIRQLS